ncbi:helix-turn-helix domain-containing protein [Lactobacillus mulieris]|uniref:helix-turn-helix domain-containing protein n=1 Tax=Lactobacillus mulieris TaxID=2508708 RepID=UPI0022CD71B7|nr:helix-turn-helix domain-containing protein [Lactobacillus mulieris]MCZ9647255.1 helix-turn-helix domain-containing protein [Lactobacillus mulieris]
MANIGEKLRSAREAMGLSIADVEKTTKIQSRYLTAIENSDFDKLPGDFYVRAFIRQYAQVVGLDGKELLAEYHQDVPETNSDEYVENSIDNKTEEVKKTTNSKKGMLKNQMPRIILGAGVVIVIVIIYVLITSLFRGSSQQASDAGDSVTVSSQSDSSSSSEKASSSTEKSHVKITRLGYGSYQVTGLKSNRNLVIHAGTNNLSASVTIDGETKWSGSISSDSKHTVKIPESAKSVSIYLSNDTGTKVTVGGKKIPYTPAGTSLNLRLTIGKVSSSSNSGTTQSSTTTSSSSAYTQSSQASSSQTTTNQTNTNQTSQNTTNQNTGNTGTTDTTGNTGAGEGQNNGGQ